MFYLEKFGPILSPVQSSTDDFRRGAMEALTYVLKDWRDAGWILLAMDRTKCVEQ